MSNEKVVVDMEPLTNGGPKPKPDGRIATLEKKVAQLEIESQQVRWCFAELMHNLQLAAAQQMLAKPEVQEQLKQAIAAKLAQGGSLM